VPEKPATADGYRGEQVDLVRATCLYVATKLGDLMDDLVVVGGLVPSLIIDPDGLDERTDRHVGTMDLDMGMALSLLDQARYRTITDRLRRAGFRPDVNAAGNPTRQRWTIEGRGRVSVDFLIPPTQPGDVGGTLRDIETDFAAVIAPGLPLAFRDRQRVTLSGRTIMGETAVREINVCGPGAFVVLKALAFGSRGENKDAYDLSYVVRNYGSGVEDVARCLRPLVDDPAGVEAMVILRSDFTDHDGVGPCRVAEFMTGGLDDAIQADVVGFVGRLLSCCE
jgi:hypothetical protein